MTMGILQRFSDIMRSNINDLLDRAEDPSKMVDQYLRDYREQLAEVKKQTAGVMANEKSAQRAVDECQKNIDRYANSAMNALRAGNEDDARTLLAKKQEFEAQMAGLRQNLAAATDSADKMRQMYNKLTADISELESRKATVKAKMATAKAQEVANRFSYSGDKADAARAAFERMEQKADRLLDTANATAELNTGMEDSAESLAAKYGSGSPSTVDDELAAMKAKLFGQQS